MTTRRGVLSPGACVLFAPLASLAQQQNKVWRRRCSEANYRGAAALVHTILKGARSCDLPIESPTGLVLAVDLTTAKALGVTLPSSILVRANKVIE
jgi:ABC-type uncharacterized transport system substrate-binding protein